jgi:hypothetical protein
MSLVGIRLRYEGEWMSLTEAVNYVGNSSNLYMDKVPLEEYPL